MPNSPTEIVGFRLPVQTKAEFQQWCNNHGTTVTKQLVAMVEACLLSPDFNQVDWLGNVFRHYTEKLEFYHEDLRNLERYTHNFKHLEDVIEQSDHQPLSERVEDLENLVDTLMARIEELEDRKLIFHEDGEVTDI